MGNWNENCTGNELAGLCMKGMKYALFGFVLALVFSMKAIGAEAGGQPLQVEGAIKENTTWRGRVLVAGDVLVPDGVTLTIEPGSEIMFMPSESSKIEPAFLSMQTEILVRGTLYAFGTREKDIKFMAAPQEHSGKTPERGDWGGIIFDGKTSSGSIIKVAVITQAETGLSFYGSTPTVEMSTIEDCRYGVVSMDGAEPILRKVLVTGCEFGVVSGPGSSPFMFKCGVEKNEINFQRK